MKNKITTLSQKSKKLNKAQSAYVKFKDNVSKEMHPLFIVGLRKVQLPRYAKALVHLFLDKYEFSEHLNEVLFLKDNHPEEFYSFSMSYSQSLELDEKNIQKAIDLVSKSMLETIISDLVDAHVSIDFKKGLSAGTVFIVLKIENKNDS